MRDVIQIPAVLEQTNVVRIFRCTVGTMRLGEPNLNDHYDDVDVGDEREADHALALETIKEWRRERNYILVFAYQVLAVSRILDDRSSWQHPNRSTQIVQSPLAPKTYVLDAPWVKTFTLASLRADLEWYRHQYGYSRTAGLRDLDNELHRRLINGSTSKALHALLVANPTLGDSHMLLKLGVAAYVPFGNDMEYRPETTANVGVKLNR